MRCRRRGGRGREKLHFLNPVPLQDIYERWIRKFERPRLKALRDLKRRLEKDGEDEGPSRCTIELELVDNAVKLTITHEIERPDSKLVTAVSGGWPRILSNLESLLETGEIAITSHPGH